MSGADVAALVLIVFTLWVTYRAMSKPRTTPKVPRDRSRDPQVVFWFRLF